MKLINRESVIRHKRQELCYSCREVGLMIGMTAHSAAVNFNMLETGKLPFSLKRARKIADVLEININDIIKECK